MVQFTPERLAFLKEKLAADSRLLDGLRKGCDRLIETGVRIPASGVATWGHYFACPDDGKRLKFDYSADHDFVCPVCGRVLNGEPYLGGWWRIVNGVNMGTAYNAALLWLFCGGEKYRELAAQILLGYAENYPNYEEHGDIPYNKPGRMNSQILDEATSLDSLARTYDILKDSLSEAQREFIESNLLLPGAEILKKNRTDQIHNHEVLVDSALGIIGLALDRYDLVDFAVNSKYGLIYQLEHAVLDDRMWFENTFHYHFFALRAFMSYEKMAFGTEYSLLDRPEYRQMYLMPLKLVQADFSLPRLGDGGSVPMFAQLAEHYEFMYKVYGDREFAAMLDRIYEKYPRDELEALLYGKARIEPAGFELDDYHNDKGSGLTALRSRDKTQYLLFRHGRYGGEHDHYDKLSLHYSVNGTEVLPDLGTVPYGSPKHYRYFKNTFTHNTVCINTQNQPPCNGETLRFEQNGGETLIECRADWTKPAQMPDSYFIKQWDDEAYAGVRFERTILFTDEFFLEAFRVRGARGRQVDWILHPKGRCEEENAVKSALKLAGSPPTEYFRNARGWCTDGLVKSSWICREGRFSVCSFCSAPSLAVYAEAPDNPAENEITYFIRRVESAGDDLVFAALFRMGPVQDELAIDKAEINGGKVRISFKLNGKAYRREYTVGEYVDE